MTSSSSLYGSVNTQNTNSSNSTSLYGGADTPIPDSSGNVIVRGDLWVLSGNILTTATTGNIFPANATTINFGTAATAINIGAGSGTTTINNALTVGGTVTAPGADFGNITIGVATDNTITTTTGNLILTSATGDLQLAQDTSFLYSENNDRLNRPTFQSTTGNTSGLRVAAPNTGSSAQGLFSVINSSDNLNAEFIQMGARGSALTNPFRFFTGKYTAGVLGATNKSISFADNTNTYATVNPAGPTTGTDLTTKTYVDALVASGVTSITGTANQVIASSPTGAVTLSLPQDIATTSNVTFGTATADFVYADEVRAKTDNIVITTEPSGKASLGLYEDVSNPNGLALISVNSNLWYFIDDGRTQFPNYTFPAADGAVNTVLTTDGAGNVSWALPGGGGSTFGNITVAVANDNTISTTTGGLTVSTNSGDLTLAPSTSNIIVNPATTVEWAENSTRANRLEFKSTNGNTTGIRTVAPVATTSALTAITAFNTNDPANGSFVALVGSGAVTNPLSIRTGTYTANVLGPSGTSLAFIDNATAYATVNPSGPTNSTDLTTKTYVDGLIPTVVTYNIDASSVSGGANFNLTGSNASTDTIKIANGTNVTAVATDANTITISATDTNTTYTYAAGSASGGANLTLTGSDATTNTVKLTNAGHITATYTSATAVTLGSDATDANTASTIVARDASGNFTAGTITATLSGTATQVSNSLTAGTHLSGGPFNGSSAVTLSTDATDANTASTIVARDASGNFTAGTITAALSGNATTATTAGKVANALTAGTHLSGGPFDGSAAVTLTTDATNANTASTIVARDASGDFSAGTITANLANNSYVLGALEATTNSAYTFPGPALNSITNNNGLDAASSMPASTQGNAAQQQIIHYYGDTFAGTATSAALLLKSAPGNSVTGGSVPFTGVAQVAPSATQLNGVLGTINYNGYGTTGFTEAVATQNQGGGFVALSATQLQSYAAEAFADGTLTISGATITTVTRVNTALASVTVTGTKGQIGFTSFSSPAVGMAIVVTGTNTGTSTGISAGNYYMVAVSGTTACTLSATPGGVPITTTAGTTTGLTFTRQFITVGYSAQSNIPFGLNAKVAVANITNVTAGTYMAIGTSTTTSLVLGAISTGAPTLPGTQSLSATTVTAAATGFRARAYPATTPMNSGNRLELIDHKASAATYRADTFIVSGGAYGNTSTARLTVDSAKITAALPIQFPSYTAAAANAITGALGQQIAISNSASGGNPNGMMAFWDTTNVRWSYIHDNSAV